MAMGRNLRILHNMTMAGSPAASPYSLVMEQRGKSDEVLLVENYAINTLDKAEYEKIKAQYVKHIDAHACLGILRVNEGEHVLYFLVLVTGFSSVGKVGNCEIYRVNNVAFVSMRGVAADEEKIVEMKKLLMSGSFFFSWSTSTGELPIDLTLSFQKSVKQNAETENRFFWNRMLHIPFLRHNVNTSEWPLIKLICGSVEIRTVYVGAKQAKAVLISRISSERAGTRFRVRGVDDQGNVANFAESEQAIFVDNTTTSFVQLRGSVPLFWDQPGINVGKHNIRMSRGPEFSRNSFDHHLKKLKKNYGNVIIVNLLGSSLVDKEGEATLSTAFQTHHKSCDLDVPHILYDLHAEKHRDKELKRLKDKVASYVQKFGYFYCNRDQGQVREQLGVARSNCADCLDRTNYVQTFIGSEVLMFQLADLGLNDKPNIVSRFQEMFKQMWLNNGNELSKMYAGTGALGASSKLVDGARSAARTIQNNLLDSTKQEAIDVLLFGSSFNSDLADRARVLLPSNYINAPKPILDRLVSKYLDYTEPLPLRVAVGTYNINGGKHFRSIVYKDVSLDDWLLDAHKTVKQSALIDLSESSTDERKPIDVYAIGFEEMVDLDAKNILKASSENAKSWAQELTKTLNRDEKYSLLTYQQLVGVCLYVFVRPELAPHIKDVAVDTVKTGMGGATGNKGAVAIRFRYHSTSVCFVCSHFAAGQSNITDRNNDYSEAIKRIIFPKGRTLLSHDYVFWCGDFNYRINMGRDDVKALVEAKDWATLLSADQLKIEQGAGNTFNGFQEGEVNFAPTYKYDLFSDDYDTSEKLRVPAWTDRVLWRKRKLRNQNDDVSQGSCHWYGRAELKQSDHRPIMAIIDVEALSVNTLKREKVFEEAMKTVGPPDGSILATFRDPEVISSAHRCMTELVEKLEEIGGKIRFTKVINATTVWIAFMDHSKVLTVVEQGQLLIGGQNVALSLRTPNWKVLLEKELKLCSDNSIPLCGDKDLNMRKESARLLSQLSQLSFEELEDITHPVEESAPPPPRPTAPPARPGPPPARPGPPTRPSQPPARPGPPPSRPAPPPSRPAAVESDSALEQDEEKTDKSAGFSDIFTVTSPIVESDLPISSSSGSIVDMTAKAQPSHSSSSNSLEYPENYDPLKESGKAWENGTEQTIPGQEVPNLGQGEEAPPADLPPPPPPPPANLPKVPPRQNSTSSSSSSSTPSTPQALGPKKGGRQPPPPPPPTSGRAPPPVPSRGAPPPVPKR